MRVKPLVQEHTKKDPSPGDEPDLFSTESGILTNKPGPGCSKAD